jgi:hypothetical protein
MTQAGQMVNFPGVGSGYEDSGEGGLFVMMLVPKPEDWQDNCHVDVVTDVRLTRPDVCVSVESRELWVPWEHRKSDFDKQSEAHRVLTEQGKPELASWAMRARNWDEFSVSLLASVHMGSSVSSWCHPQDSYWEATTEDLTGEGQMLRVGLKSVFGIEPLLLTFLDT